MTVDEDVVYLLNEMMIELGERLVNWRLATSATNAVHATPSFDTDELQRTAAALAISRTEPILTPIYAFVDVRALTHTTGTEDQQSSDSNEDDNDDNDDDNDDLLSDDDIELSHEADLAQELEEDRLVESFRVMDVEDDTVY